MPQAPLTTPRSPPETVGPSPGEESAAGLRLPLRREVLAPPREAHPLPRPPMGPVGHWLRRLERRFNLEMGNRVYPHIPGMRLPYSYQLQRNLVLTVAEVEVRRLPAAFDGTRVLLMTDIHTGPFLHPATLAHAFDRLMDSGPDLILLGGDLTTGSVEEFEPFMEAFRRLRAPLGVHGVLGNHDYYSGRVHDLIPLLEECGIALLQNQGVTLTRKGEHLALAGIEDLHWGRPDLPAALGPGAPPHILLSHNPDIFFDAAWRGVDLVLAGHTHGGQIRLPGLPPVVKMSRYALDEGRYISDASHLVVSRGMGVTGVPLRWDCAPEAVQVTLRCPLERSGF
ncbi:MAG: metallophosphoesterase [Acidobacteria bacterium]|nr:MAG: metallophosphoesterase [Acidobacteriota bacterium]